jgi:hypothetical protein
VHLLSGSEGWQGQGRIAYWNDMHGVLRIVSKDVVPLSDASYSHVKTGRTGSERMKSKGRARSYGENQRG